MRLPGEPVRSRFGGEAEAVSIGTRFVALLSDAEARAIPLSVTFEITLACNLHCAHCYNFDRLHPPRSAAAALPSKRIHGLIDEIRAEGALFLALTGGEPMLHPHLRDFVHHAASLGLFVRLKSNGTHFTTERVAALSAAGLQAVDVSLYGSKASTHDAFARHPGAFARTVAGIRAARDAALEARISFVITTHNASEVSAMNALAEDLGVACNMDLQITARYDGTRSSLDAALHQSDFERLYRGPLAEFAVPTQGSHPQIACPCARSVCGITATGDIYPCIGAPLPAGNVSDVPFREVWRTSKVLNWIRALRNKDFPACNSCPHLTFCKRTSGVLLSNMGEFTGPSKFGEDLTCVEAEVVHRLAEERSFIQPPKRQNAR